MSGIAAAFIARCAPIGLDELNGQAALQSRVDRKYLVPAAVAVDLAGWLDPDARILTIDGAAAQRYRSVYFDTPELIFYRQAAYRRRRRFKLRTRVYLDSGAAFLEAKTKGVRGVTEKMRIPHSRTSLRDLDDDARRYAAGVLRSAGLPSYHAWALEPVLATGYRRVTILVPSERGSDAAPARLTVDTGLRWEMLAAGGGIGEAYRTDLAIVETKSGRRASGVDHALWRHGVRPVAISKYCTGMARLRSDLPANKWARVLTGALQPAPDHS